MNRVDVYTTVHKMQRARLFELTVDAGKADSSDTVATARIAAAVDALCVELAAHADHEDRFIHPFLREHAPAVAGALDTEHLQLDTELDELHRVAATYASEPKDPNVLHRALSAFTATYLSHLAREEGEALPALWESCSDDELISILSTFKASRSDTENLTSLLAQLPTLNPTEVERMVTMGVGPIGTSDLAEILATVLRPDQLGALHRAAF